MRLTLECIGHFESLLQVQPGLAHFLDGYKLVMKQGILCLVDGSHAPLAQLSNDVVAFLQQVTWRECPGRDVVGSERFATFQSMAAGKTKSCLPFISGSTVCERLHSVCNRRRRKKKPYHLLLENNSMGANYRSFQFQISPRTVPREAVIAPTSMAKGSETSISNQPDSST